MAYNSFNIEFTDAANGEIVILPNQVDSYNTSLLFVGKNAPSYAYAFNSNFLHLLENFSAPTEQPPTNPVQGQLWYDNEKKKLYVRDADWRPVNGIWQQATEPGIDNTPTPNTGDIWVNTEANQISIYNGSSFTLVGPSYSGTTKTGSYPTIIKDNFGENHYVIKNFVDDQVVEIISVDQFTPQQPISGFSNIYSGVTLSSNNNSRFYGRALSAEKLHVTSPTTQDVNANYFVRNDINNTINATLTITGGVGVGDATVFTIFKEGTGKSVYKNNVFGGKHIFRTRRNSAGTNLVDLLTLNGFDGINPASVVVNGVLSVTSATSLSVVTATNATFSGNVAVNSNLNVFGVSTFTGLVNLTDTVTLGSSTAPVLKSILKPTISGYYDVGTSSASFRRVYASAFGNNAGTIFYGRLTGSASSLTNATSFSIEGHVQSNVISSNGDGTAVTFQSTLTTTAISDQLQVYETDTDDEILIHQPSSGNLAKITIEDLTREINYVAVPAGSIILNAGYAVPEGWLICNGSEVNILDYTNLFAAIGLTYGTPSEPTKMVLPNLVAPDPNMNYIIKV